MNMAFYQYTFVKQLKSVSTYITGVIALIPIIIVLSLTLKASAPSGEAMLVASFIGFPISIIFMSFKISQIFKDEIENKTILSFQSKPITRRQMVFQGIFVLLTWAGIFSFGGVLIPFIIAAIKVGAKSIEYGFIVTAIELLLLSMISIIGLWISLSLSGKAFVATMIGGFVVGFFILLFVSSLFSGMISKTKRSDNLESSIKTKVSQSLISIKESTVDGKDTFEITAGSDPKATDAIEAIYSDAQGVDKTSAYTVLAWFLPSTHWAQMWSAGIGATSDEHGDAKSILSTLNSEETVKITKVVKDLTGKVTSFTFYEERKTIVPSWFPFILWILIGGAIIPIVIRSISRKNIA